MLKRNLCLRKQNKGEMPCKLPSWYGQIEHGHSMMRMMNLVLIPFYSAMSCVVPQHQVLVQSNSVPMIHYQAMYPLHI